MVFSSGKIGKMIECSVASLFKNTLLLSVALAWFVAQSLKVVFTYFDEKKINFHRLIEPGGMPSSHAAMATSLLTGVGIKEGLSSSIFIVALIFSLAIIYEAIGVRRAVGEQAEILNQVARKLSLQKNSNNKKNREGKILQETIGHTPLQVMVGCMIGFVIAFVWVGQSV